MCESCFEDQGYSVVLEGEPEALEENLCRALAFLWQKRERPGGEAPPAE